MAEKENQLEKAISICDKPVATLKEIMDGCGSVFRVLMGNKPKGETGAVGLISCSHGRTGLALCIWQEKEDGKFERVKQVVVGVGALASLQGIIGVSLQRLERKYADY